MAHRGFKDETELAGKVVTYLEALGWDVYSEVVFSAANTRADIAAVKDDRLWIIECKTAASLLVMHQAYSWPVHYRSVAVPMFQTGKPSQISLKQFVKGVAKDYAKVGILEVGSFGVREMLAAPFMPEHERTSKLYKSMLRQEHKDLVSAGSSKGGYFTKYKETMALVRGYVSDHLGCSVAEVVEALGKMHYATSKSARSSIMVGLSQYEQDWCRIDSSDVPARLYIKENL